jgi:hypothetical protein
MLGRNFGYPSKFGLSRVLFTARTQIKNENIKSIYFKEKRMFSIQYTKELSYYIKLFYVVTRFNETRLVWVFYFSMPFNERDNNFSLIQTM